MAIFKDEFINIKVEEKEDLVNAEWVWVKGYKATPADMVCFGHRYELGVTYEMSAEDIELCKNGYHFCLKLENVLNYRSIGKGMRFFEVEAQAPRARVIEAKLSRKDKLVAKSIRLVRELTADEVFAVTPYRDFTEEEKAHAMQTSPGRVVKNRRKKELVALGYSELLSAYFADNGKYEIAKAVASQPELSMEMKILAICTLDD